MCVSACRGCPECALVTQGSWGVGGGGWSETKGRILADSGLPSLPLLLQCSPGGARSDSRPTVVDSGKRLGGGLSGAHPASDQI